MLEDFKAFVMRGNVVDLAVGVIIGAAFGTVVSSLVADVLMPPIGLVLGNVDFSNLFLVLSAGTTPAPYATLAAARDAGAVTLNYGLFLTQVISFLIVAVAVFLVVKAIAAMQRTARDEAAAAPPAPPAQELLLREIRDLLKKA